MGGVQEVQLQIRGSPKDTEAGGDDRPQPHSKLRHWRWWAAVAANVFFILAGQTVATLLGRLYYNEGGSSMWMATLVQSAGAPLLLIPFLLLLPPSSESDSSPTSAPRAAVVALTYVALGLLIAGDNLMYSYGLLYLPVSTYSLVCSTQLAFSVVFAYFLNAQKFTALILNSVVLLVFAAALLGVSSGSDGSSDVPKGKYPLGFVLTLGASATFSLILSLMQRAFQRVLRRRETFAVVVEMQMCTNAAAACASAAGLLASGEWRGLGAEMEGYGKGRVAYVMTLLWTAVSWQVSSVGTLGLIFLVSSLFSNVISTLALPVVPVFAVVFFRDKMDGVKVVAMLIAAWGFLSYIYQHYIDYSKAKRSGRDEPNKLDDTDTSS